VDQNLPHHRGLASLGLRSVLRGARLRPCDRARRQGGDGEVRQLLALRQPQGVRGDQPWRTQECLLGDVRDMCSGGEVLKRQAGEPHLPSGYRLDIGDPDMFGVAPARRHKALTRVA
jgi:hypothetical protein